MKDLTLLRIPLIGFTLLLMATLPLLLLPNIWQDWPPASCLPDNCFCEADRDGLIIQPANTYSNLAYIAVGLWVLAQARRPRPAGAVPRNLLERQPAYSVVYGLAAVAIGLGSFFYHTSLTFAGQWFDLMGMYLLITLVILFNLARLRPLAGSVFTSAYFAANAALGLWLVILPASRREVFMALVFVALALEAIVRRTARARAQTGYFWAALGSLALAYLVWNLDNLRVLCAPESLFQGHALWHILTAGAVALLYLYYRSESAGALPSVRGERRSLHPNA